MDLFANCDPTALSKKPGEEGLLAAGCLGAALVGVEGLDANCAPTALSKKPPPEEVGLGEEGLEEPFDAPATEIVIVDCGWEPNRRCKTGGVENTPVAELQLPINTPEQWQLPLSLLQGMLHAQCLDFASLLMAARLKCNAVVYQTSLINLIV